MVMNLPGSTASWLGAHVLLSLSPSAAVLEASVPECFQLCCCSCLGVLNFYFSQCFRLSERARSCVVPDPATKVDESALPHFHLTEIAVNFLNGSGIVTQPRQHI